ncbi:MAG: hypothetical protein M1820_000121 [Bogoriella megaspora]|nr:MAG: hypothetical protein M1820_000121 [Bogoriella megaspora]
MASPNQNASSSTLLRLPVEILDHILSFILPYPRQTHLDTFNFQHAAWERSNGGTTVLRVCRFLSELALEQTYRNAVFTVDIDGRHGYVDRDLYLGRSAFQCVFFEGQLRRLGWDSRDRKHGGLNMHCIGDQNVKRIRKCHIRINEPFYDHSSAPRALDPVPWACNRQSLKELVALFNEAYQEIDFIRVDLGNSGPWQRIKEQYYLWQEEESSWELDAYPGNSGYQSNEDKVDEEADRAYFLAYREAKYFALQELKELRGVKTAEFTGPIPQVFRTCLEQAMTRPARMSGDERQ